MHSSPADFKLATAETESGTAPVLIEVYPHPALIRLCDAEVRLALQGIEVAKVLAGPIRIGRSRESSSAIPSYRRNTLATLGFRPSRTNCQIQQCSIDRRDTSRWRTSSTRLSQRG
jgi:hypothetical protein